MRLRVIESDTGGKWKKRSAWSRYLVSPANSNQLIMITAGFTSNRRYQLPSFCHPPLLQILATVARCVPKIISVPIALAKISLHLLSPPTVFYHSYFSIDRIIDRQWRIVDWNSRKDCKDDRFLTRIFQIVEQVYEILSIQILWWKCRGNSFARQSVWNFEKKIRPWRSFFFNPLATVGAYRRLEILRLWYWEPLLGVRRSLALWHGGRL